MTYRSIFFSSDGIAVGSLNPTWDMYKRLSTGSDLSQPLFSEVGSGFYRYSDTVPSGQVFVGLVDGGASLSDTNRYKSVEDRPDYDYLASLSLSDIEAKVDILDTNVDAIEVQVNANGDDLSDIGVALAAARSEISIVDGKVTDLGNYNTVNVMPVYDAEYDTVTFFVFYMNNGQTVTTDLVSAEVAVYDEGHSELYTTDGTANSNGVFVLTKSSPDIANGSGYYIVASVTTSTETFTSNEMFVALD